MLESKRKIGGASSKGWAKSASLVGIGLTDLPKIMVASGTPGTPSSGIPGLQTHGDRICTEIATKNTPNFRYV